MKFTSQGHKLTKTANHRTIQCCFSLTLHPHTIKGLLTHEPFTQYIKFSFQNIARHTKSQKTQSEDTELVASEPGPDMAGALEISDQELKQL